MPIANEVGHPAGRSAYHYASWVFRLRLLSPPCSLYAVAEHCLHTRETDSLPGHALPETRGHFIHILRNITLHRIEEGPGGGRNHAALGSTSLQSPQSVLRFMVRRDVYSATSRRLGNRACRLFFRHRPEGGRRAPPTVAATLHACCFTRTAPRRRGVAALPPPAPAPPLSNVSTGREMKSLCRTLSLHATSRARRAPIVCCPTYCLHTLRHDA